MFPELLESLGCLVMPDLPGLRDHKGQQEQAETLGPWDRLGLRVLQDRTACRV